MPTSATRTALLVDVVQVAMQRLANVELDSLRLLLRKGLRVGGMCLVRLALIATGGSIFVV